MKTHANMSAPDIRWVEAEAFRDGANDVPKDTAVAELDATFGRRKSEAREEGIPLIKDLEARVKTFLARAQEATARWEALKQKHVAAVPRLFVPLVYLTLTVFTVIAEGTLLAPIMDAFGIANPDHQLIAAGTFVAAAAILFHLYLSNREQETRKLLPSILAGVMAVGLIVLGIMRAEELTFAATLAGSLLGQFLTAHPWLGKTLFVLFTFAFPVAAAVGLHEGTNRIHEWWEYRKARRQAKKFSTAANHTEKLLESEKDQLEQQLAQLDEQAKEWKSTYETFHALGAAVGAKRRSVWTIWAKATGLAMLVFVIAAFAVSFTLHSPVVIHFVLCGLLAAAVWVIAVVHYYRKWQNPSPKEYLRLAHLRFRNDDEGTTKIPVVIPALPSASQQSLLVATPVNGHATEVRYE